MSKIIPVIHHLNSAHSLAQADVAAAEGADGVFLISHDGKDKEVLQAAGELRQRWAGRPLFVGINLLNTSAATALEYAAKLRLDGLWVDAPGVSSMSQGRSPVAQRLAAAMEKWPSVKVFGSVAFKYQDHEPDPPAAAQAADAMGMVATTSGTATGVAPDVDKIRSMSAAVDGRLAVASGMTPENVAEYAPFLSHVLVATGVSSDEHNFDPTRLARFVAAARSVTGEPSPA